MPVLFDLNGGLHPVGIPLNLDEVSGSRLTIATHIEIDGLKKQGKVLAASPLVPLFKTKSNLDILPLEFERPLKFGRVDIRLFPSGYMRGGAFVVMDIRDTKVCYVSFTGLGQRRALSEPPRIPRCDMVVMRVVPGLKRPRSSFDAVQSLRPLLQDSLDSHAGVLILTPSTPDGVELAVAMRNLGFKVLLHPSIKRVSDLLGVPGFKAVKRPPGSRKRGAIVVWPDRLRHSRLLDDYRGPIFSLPPAEGDFVIPFSGSLDTSRALKILRSSKATSCLILSHPNDRILNTFSRSGARVNFLYHPSQQDLPLSDL